MTTFVLASILAALAGTTACSRRASCSPASTSSCDNGTSNAAQIALSSSLDASLRPRSTSDRYPRLTRAASETSRNVRPCLVRARRSTSPRTSRSNDGIPLSLIRSAETVHQGQRPPLGHWFPTDLIARLLLRPLRGRHRHRAAAFALTDSRCRDQRTQPADRLTHRRDADIPACSAELQLDHFGIDRPGQAH